MTDVSVQIKGCGMERFEGGADPLLNNVTSSMSLALSALRVAQSFINQNFLILSTKKFSRMWILFTVWYISS
jgi:hypothetical protein